MLSMKKILALLLLFYISAISGCVHNTPSADELGRVLILNADNDINPNEYSQSAPLNVFIYQLRATEQFQEQQDDFFSTTSGKRYSGFANDIISVKEIIIRPGEQKEVWLKTSPDEVAIGIVAAFRNINKSQWKRLIIFPVRHKRPWYQFFDSAGANQLNIHFKKLSVDAQIVE